MTVKPPAETIKERYTTHGDFENNAEISQALKSIFRKSQRYDAVFQEALDMIAMKLSRILSGNELYFDHWKDIAGYAYLAEGHCLRLEKRRLEAVPHDQQCGSDSNP